MDQLDEPPVFTADDDGLHSHLADGEWWFTETAWFSFHHAPSGLGGWFYTMIRPTIGTVAGGAWVWDDSAHLPWEALYSANYSALQLPPDTDLRHTTLPTGVSLAVEEPTRAYRLGYEDTGRFTADLRFEAAMAPRPLTASGSTFGRSAHFDQIGRITGSIEVAGRSLDIDCWSMRDRTWGRRPEDRPRQAAYVTGAASGPDGGDGFLAVTNTRDGYDRVAYGFVLRGGGDPVALVDGERSVTRHPDHGWVTDIRIEATDALGRPFAAEGRPMSRIVINRHSFIDINSLVEWQVTADGSGQAVEWWGEDQDMWPVHRWAASARLGDWGPAANSNGRG